MTVLVAVGSKYGATREIAQTIADVLTDSGVEARCHEAKDVVSIDGYSAIVLGSAVYGGFWRRDASEFARLNGPRLMELPTWLFSSGPVGLPPRPSEAAGEGDALASKLGAREHRVFSGFLNPDKLNMGERALIKGLRASVGDYREWGQVKSWAREIANQIAVVVGDKD